MEKFIGMIAAVLVLAYVGVAIWTICKRETLGGCIAVSAGFLCGGLVIIPAAEAAAVFIGWAVIGCIVLAVIRAIFGA